MPTGFIPAGASARPMSPVGRALSPGPMSAVPLQQFATPMLGGAAGAAWRGAGEGRGAGVRGERRLAHVRQLACVPACAAVCGAAPRVCGPWSRLHASKPCGTEPPPLAVARRQLLPRGDECLLCRRRHHV